MIGRSLIRRRQFIADENGPSYNWFWDRAASVSRTVSAMARRQAMWASIGIGAGGAGGAAFRVAGATSDSGRSDSGRRVGSGMMKSVYLELGPLRTAANERKMPGRDEWW